MAAEGQDAIAADRETDLTSSVGHWTTDHARPALAWEHCVTGQRVELTPWTINDRTPESQGDQIWRVTVVAPEREAADEFCRKGERTSALMAARAWMQVHRDGMGVVE